jgi:hypothetical protein
MKNAVFWDVTSCGFIINRRFGGSCRLHLQVRKNNASEENCYTVTNRPTNSSKTSVYNKPTRRHIPEDSILLSHRRENLGRKTEYLADKNINFWDILSFSLVIFRETYGLHVYGWKVSQASRQAWLYYSATLKMETVHSPETLVNSTRLHDITTHKTTLVTRGPQTSNIRIEVLCDFTQCLQGNAGYDSGAYFKLGR